ncbi:MULTISPECIES: F-type conjugal transfer protein TrbB [unclassified Klebsiella]|uniref:F-type conjugal transfer protein TrbB n=1 Tax=unclassified Klebsiella TaxID=2608929 RepID=UPI0015DBE5D5|nr:MULTISPECIES: F-type conjugal transfer protein TrbB [unclassified Klebsiella]BBQ86590.1 conjugal transfer protein TrbB [Klebsiella sp. WP3-W18-ESBL-02]BBR23793.1 conjugal transfer protein TrbB [Klebsiella sp. WP3-S18-ESBL-05]
MKHVQSVMRYALLGLMLVSVGSAAGTSIRDQIAALEAGKVAQKVVEETPAQPTVRRADKMQLPGGRIADMSQYAVVLFMQAHCQYSAKFDPQLKAWADQHGIKVWAYTLDGGGDPSFPVPLIPRRSDPNSAIPIADEIMTFFGNGLPIATPTAFMVNVNTLKAYPLTQGVMEIPALEGRYATLIQADMDQVDPRNLPPLPASTQVTPQ